MKELTKPISEVRQKLPALAKAADERMARVVITQQGRPQAVLLGYEDYLGMKTAVELLSRPGLVEGMEDASAELERGEGIELEGLKEAVQSRADEAGKVRITDFHFRPKLHPGRMGEVHIGTSSQKELEYEGIVRDFGASREWIEIPVLKAKALLNKGNALTRLGKTDEAIASYDEMLDLLSSPMTTAKSHKEPADVLETKLKR